MRVQKLETINNGKPVEDSKGDVFMSADCIDYCMYLDFDFFDGDSI